MLMTLWYDDSGAVISAELTLVLTIAVLGVIVGLSEVAVAVNTELNDISNAVGALDQSYSLTFFCGRNGGGKLKSANGGSAWSDDGDDCDVNLTCDLVGGAPGAPTGG